MPKPAEEGRAPGPNRNLAIVSAFVGILLVPILLFVLQSDCVFYYHYARYLLRVDDPRELLLYERHRPGAVPYALPREEGVLGFESMAQREEFLDRLPSRIRTKEDLSQWVIACLESKSPSLVMWALRMMRPGEMLCMPHRSKIISLTKQYSDSSDRLGRSARRTLQENSATHVVLAKWAILLGIAVTGVIAFKKHGKVSLKRPVFILGIAQAVVPAAVVFVIFVAASSLVGGGGSGQVSGLFAAIHGAKIIGIVCKVCLVTGWAFVMWSLVARIKGSASSRLSLLWPVLLAVLININMLSPA